MFTWCRISHRLTSSAQECDFIFSLSLFHAEETGKGLLAAWAALLSRDLEGRPHPWVTCLLFDRPASSAQLPAATCGCVQDYETSSCSKIRHTWNMTWFNHDYSYILISVNYYVHRFHRGIRPTTRFSSSRVKTKHRELSMLYRIRIYLQNIFWSVYIAFILKFKVKVASVDAFSGHATLTSHETNRKLKSNSKLAECVKPGFTDSLSVLCVQRSPADSGSVRSVVIFQSNLMMVGLY